MKLMILVTILAISFTTSLSSQVNFELDFTFSKIYPNYELAGIQLFDYDNNSNEELFVGYKRNNYWSIVCYSLNGDTLFTHTLDNEDDERIQKFYMFNNEDISYLVTASTFLQTGSSSYCDSILVRMYDIETFCLIESYFYYFDTTNYDDFGLEITTIKVNKLIDNFLIYIGLNTIIYNELCPGSQWELEKESSIIKLLFHNNVITFLEKIPNSGTQIYYNDYLNIFYSVGRYNYSYTGGCGQVWNGNTTYYLKTISNDIISEATDILQISGSYSGDEFYGTSYYSYPVYFNILTNNDDYSLGYGCILCYQIRDSEFEKKLICFSPDLLSINWEHSDTLSWQEYLSTPTCINTNQGNYSLLYFIHDSVKVLNRINGEIILTDSVSIQPFSIQKKFEDGLLFFVELDDIDEYWVYKINGEIIISIDEENLPSISQKYLFDKYPNPFSSSTSIFLTGTTDLRELRKITIYNLKGQVVKELQIDNIELGMNEVKWDGKNSNGKKAASGIYFCVIKDGKNEVVRKMVKIASS